MTSQTFSIATFAKKFFWFLVVVQLLFVVLEGIHFTLKQNFNERYEPMRDSLFTLHSLQYEDSIGTWLSVMINMLVAVVVFLIYRNASKEFKWRRWGWLVISLFFCYLSIDDTATLHEQAGVFYESQVMAVADSEFRLATYGWQYIYGPFFAGMGFFVFGFCWFNMKQENDKFLILTGLTFFAFAVGLDFFEGGEERFRGFCESWDIDFLTGTLSIRLIEEFFEMLGSAILFLGFARHLDVMVKEEKKQIEFV